MSGHSKWSQIKHQKGVTDKKRAVLFSKLLKAISVAAKNEPNPNFNPRLRTAVETAKQNNVSKDNIDRAISKASETKNLEELIIEGYGPEKVAIIIEVITDNRNRSTNEIRNVFNENYGKMGEMGSAKWAFNVPQPGGAWTPKFTQDVSPEGHLKLQCLIEALENHDDTQKVITNQSTSSIIIK
jgi:YebC/PmpR family DNA-binding regulatory protein